MSNHEVKLVSFMKPPVTEVVLSVQFEPIAGFQLHHFRSIWDAFKDTFPEVQTMPALSSMFEPLDTPQPQPAIQFQFAGGTAVLPRMWLVNKVGTELIQIQNDRFIHNWRKIGEGDQYPRYERLRKEFIAEFEVFASELEKLGLSAPRANQCEVTYINQITSGEGWADHNQVSQVTTLIRSCEEIPANVALEGVNIAARYLIRDSESNTKGRLHVEFVPAFAAPTLKTPSPCPIFVMNLTARGEPIGSGSEGVLAFFDLGREAIVNTFRAITTEQMHRIWEEEDGS